LSKNIVRKKKKILLEKIKNIVGKNIDGKILLGKIKNTVGKNKKYCWKKF